MSKTTIIFGSSFADDQEYRQICLNINRIKIAMEMGHTVILCNLNNLYESLYDALNQNYTTMSDSRYVDLGLGTHRVKCRIHKDFRLVLIAEDKDVYEKFPIPLINRLEKHYLGMETMLSEGKICFNFFLCGALVFKKLVSLAPSPLKHAPKFWGIKMVISPSKGSTNFFLDVFGRIFSKKTNFPQNVCFATLHKFSWDNLFQNDE